MLKIKQFLIKYEKYNLRYDTYDKSIVFNNPIPVKVLSDINYDIIKFNLPIKNIYVIEK